MTCQFLEINEELALYSRKLKYAADLFHFYDKDYQNWVSDIHKEAQIWQIPFTAN
jgi:hypothetical protein